MRYYLKRGLAPVQNQIPLPLRNSPDDSGQFEPQLLGVDDFGCGIHVHLKITISWGASSEENVKGES